MRQPKPKSSIHKVDASYEKNLYSITENIDERLGKLVLKHEKVNEAVKAIRSQGLRLFNGPKTNQTAKTKMTALYSAAMKHYESEYNTIEQILAEIQKRRQSDFRQKLSDKLSRGSLMVLLAQYAHSLPLYIGNVDGHPPPGVGAICKDELNEGDLLAAYVEDIWILAEVKNKISDTKYEVKDIDDERHLMLNSARLLALPEYRADPRRHGHALFPRNAIVIALYPQTTCFYKGIVESSPSTATEDYLIAFEDNTFSTGYSPTLPIPQMFVLTYREIRANRKVIISDDED